MRRAISKTQRAALRREALMRVDLFLAIGEFTFEFSQLEFTIRHLLATVLRLNNKHFDIITGPYDFAVLCSVAAEAIKRRRGCAPALAAEVESTFNACKGLNTHRVRIAHGTWTIGGGARHFSRNSMRADRYFMTPAEITAKAREAQALMNRVIAILLLPKPAKPKKRH